MISDRREDRTYSEDEIEAKLESELPHWYYAGTGPAAGRGR